MNIKPETTLRLRAAAALLALALGCFSAPISLAADEPDVCSMECCVAEGHCCCAAAKPFVEGKDYGDVAKFNLPEFRSSCPCPATPLSSYKIAHSQIARTHSCNLAEDEQTLPTQRGRDNFYRSPQLTPNSSRAPPVFPL